MNNPGIEVLSANFTPAGPPEYNGNPTAPTFNPSPDPIGSVADESLVAVRKFRDAALAQSDWTQGEDSPLSSAKKAEWATYRQELRDVTSSDTLPYEPGWPTPPSS